VQVRLSDADGQDAVLVGDRDYASRSSQALAADPTRPE
jgi:pyrimidine operon attenuation protein/uracil phosphoribosyltransferase